ncbi:hypothetical protein [Haloplasma contractile]|uniref:Uncharacterized protein n=1 Tax=Haloplasma contractile SSD-17B TaxID=1033810 RepID=U2FJQ1_9MOLU|nr:hypothetical protein [Haloplasma contractile]ERJ11484.1 hypothetical protein HLPCO_002396 [Haloplasma contractile SSD-17B]
MDLSTVLTEKVLTIALIIINFLIIIIGVGYIAIKNNHSNKNI